MPLLEIVLLLSMEKSVMIHMMSGRIKASLISILLPMKKMFHILLLMTEVLQLRQQAEKFLRERLCLSRQRLQTGQGFQPSETIHLWSIRQNQELNISMQSRLTDAMVQEVLLTSG